MSMYSLLERIIARRGMSPCLPDFRTHAVRLASVAVVVDFWDATLEGFAGAWRS